MKRKHIEGARSNARAVIHALPAHIGQNFYTLGTDQIERILYEADRVRYQKPKSANGSRARYFYARLTRQAQAPED